MGVGDRRKAQQGGDVCVCVCVCVCVSVSVCVYTHSVMSDSLQPHGL